MALLQMQGCSINKHMVDEVRQREKETELQMQRRKKALDDSHMDAQLKELSQQLADCSARASALRKVSPLLRPVTAPRSCRSTIRCLRRASSRLDSM